MTNLTKVGYMEFGFSRPEPLNPKPPNPDGLLAGGQDGERHRHHRGRGADEPGDRPRLFWALAQSSGFRV